MLCTFFFFISFYTKLHSIFIYTLI